MDLAHLIRITVLTMTLLMTVPTLGTFTRKPCSTDENLIKKIRLNVTATMSSTWRTWTADKAIDFNETPYPNTCNCCSGTTSSPAPSWWRLDLGNKYLIEKIIVIGRNDDHDSDVGHQSRDIQLYNGFSNSIDNQVLIHRNNATTGYIFEIPFKPPVLLQHLEIRNNNALAICEIKLMQACPVTKASTTSAPSLVTSSITPLKSNATVCFACQDMSSLVYCNNVQRCSQNQECYVEKHVTSGGHVRYSSGCSNTNICHQHKTRDNSCRQCCTGSYCNSVGCGDMSTPARDHRGPFCYDCQHVGRVEDCHRVRFCGSDQVCNIERSRWGDSFSHYTLSCQDMRCLQYNQTIIGLGKRSVQDCQQCCSDDFCNTHCSHALPNPGSIFG